MNVLLKQTLNIVRQNRFFSIVCILGSAVSIAFAMTFYMTYDIHTDNIHPEVNRDRMIISGQGYFFKTVDNSNCQNYLSLTVAKYLFDKLPGAENVCYYKTSWKFLGSSDKQGERSQVMYTNDGFWKIMDIKLLAGRIFSKADCEIENPSVIVISEKIARKAFGSAEAAVGKTFFCDFKSYRIIGVTENVSSMFTYAYSDAWIPMFTAITVPENLALGDLNNKACQVIVLRRKNASDEEILGQIEQTVKRLNSHLADYTFQLNDCTSFGERWFFREKTIDKNLAFAFLILLILIVPAINISGLISSQMKHRQEEIGIRKAYGAARWCLIRQLLLENLVLCVIGSIVGFFTSVGIMEVCKNFLLAANTTLKAGDDFTLSVWTFFRPSIILGVFLTCLLFNLLSVFIPAWVITRQKIVSNLKRE